MLSQEPDGGSIGWRMREVFSRGRQLARTRSIQLDVDLGDGIPKYSLTGAGAFRECRGYFVS